MEANRSNYKFPRGLIDEKAILGSDVYLINELHGVILRLNDQVELPGDKVEDQYYLCYFNEGIPRLQSQWRGVEVVWTPLGQAQGNLSEYEESILDEAVEIWETK